MKIKNYVCEFQEVPMPEKFHELIPGHLCDNCKHVGAEGTGAEWQGTWEFYFQACSLQKDEYKFMRCVDPYGDGPDENGNTVIVIACPLFEAQS